MPIDTEELLRAVALLCDDVNLRAALVGTLKGGLITGASAVLGGLLFGPVGLAIGGSIGGGAAALSSNGKFRPVSQIIREMPPNKKQQLCAKLTKAFKDFGISDLSPLLPLLLSQTSVKELAIKEVTNYLQNGCFMTVKRG